MDCTLTLPGDRRRPAHRRGFTLVYVAVALVMLFGFAALAIDVGRMELTHTQLQVAADASARAAAQKIISGGSKNFSGNETQARVTAQTVAGANAVTAEEPAGESIAIQLNGGNSDPGGDIVFGLWAAPSPGALPQFTYLAPSDYGVANAVKVLARRTGARGNALPMWFASIVWRDDADIKAEAVARISGGPITVGIVGIDWLDVWGHAGTDSYDYTVDPTPDPKTQPELFGDEGDVLSTGPIDIWGSPLIRGDAMGDTISAPNGTITGDRINVWDEFTKEELVFPPVDAAPYQTANDNVNIQSYLDSNNNFQLNNGAATFPAGTYYIHNFSLGGNATLQIAGPVTLYITGEVRLRGTVDTTGVSDDPRNFQIKVDGPGAVDLNGTPELHAIVYAPEADVETGGTSDLYGSVIGKTLEIFGDAIIHYEVHSGYTIDRPWRVKLVK